MTHFSWKIQQLRGFFVVYTVARLVAEIILSRRIFLETGEEYHHHNFQRWLTSPGILPILTILINGALFVLGLWLFHHLLKKKNWARILLLVVGWLTVVDAITSLLFTGQASNLVPWVARFAPDLDWKRIVLIDRIKDLLGLIFWGYLIVVLQFDQPVKREFIPPPGSDTQS